jgi:hypothetical protein
VSVALLARLLATDPAFGRSAEVGEIDSEIASKRREIDEVSARIERLLNEVEPGHLNSVGVRIAKLEADRDRSTVQRRNLQTKRHAVSAVSSQGGRGRAVIDLYQRAERSADLGEKYALRAQLHQTMRTAEVTATCNAAGHITLTVGGVWHVSIQALR